MVDEDDLSEFKIRFMVGMPPREVCARGCLYAEAVGAERGTSCGGIYCDHYMEES